MLTVKKGETIEVFLFDFAIWVPTLVHNLTSWNPGTLLFSRLSGCTSISNTAPSAWNKASAPMSFKLSAAKLASDWTLWQCIWPVTGSCLWSFLLPTLLRAWEAVMMSPMEIKDVATEGFPCYPGGRPRHSRCSLWLSGPSAWSQCLYLLTPGKTLIASEPGSSTAW